MSTFIPAPVSHNFLDTSSDEEDEPVPKKAKADVSVPKVVAPSAPPVSPVPASGVSDSGDDEEDDEKDAEPQLPMPSSTTDPFAFVHMHSKACAVSCFGPIDETVCQVADGGDPDEDSEEKILPSIAVIEPEPVPLHLQLLEKRPSKGEHAGRLFRTKKAY